jgi:hypothetical protein
LILNPSENILQPETMLKFKLPFLGFLQFFEGTIAILFILQTKSEAHSQFMWGLSLNRLVLICIVTLISIISIGVGLLDLSGYIKKLFVTHSSIKSLIKKLFIFLPLLILFFPLYILGAFFPERIPFTFHSYFERCIPVMIFLSTIGLQIFFFFPIKNSKINYFLGIFSICLCFAVLLVGLQFSYINNVLGGNYIWKDNYLRHMEIISNHALVPYRYRILMEYLFEGYAYLRYHTAISNVAILETLNWAGNTIYLRPFEIIGQEIRIIQNVFIFILAYIYYYSKKHNLYTSLLGLFLLSISMANVFANSDLSFNTYAELIFFLIAGIAINYKKLFWIIPITFVAALNREGAIFIPWMVILSEIKFNKSPIEIGKSIPRRKICVFILSMLAFAVVFFSLRIILGSASYARSGFGAIYPGFKLLMLNITTNYVWAAIIQTFFILPLSLLLYKNWEEADKIQFFLFVLPWSLIIFSFWISQRNQIIFSPNCALLNSNIHKFNSTSPLSHPK